MYQIVALVPSVGFRMVKKSQLGEFEMMVLLAVLRLEDGAYAVTIREDIETRTGRPVSRGAVYITLGRLLEKGYLGSTWSEPTSERGGKAKRIYSVTQRGLDGVRDSRAAMQAMWQGLEPILDRSR